MIGIQPNVIIIKTKELKCFSKKVKIINQINRNSIIWGLQEIH